MSADLARVADTWSPPVLHHQERVTAAPAMALAGLFDQPFPVAADGDPLPPLWHWLYLLNRPTQAGLGPDGHPLHGPFQPPIEHRRRMFGGGRVDFRAPIRCGERLQRRAEVSDARTREGSTGTLLLVTVRSELSVDGKVRVIEEQDFLYRSGAPPAGPRPARMPGEPGQWSLRLEPDPTLLFRFSALTYNAHRIHYDHPYATGAEGYEGLVVHGPLLALALLEIPRRFAPDRAVRRFTYRARAPLFAGQPIDVHGTRDGDTVHLDAGSGAFTGTAELA